MNYDENFIKMEHISWNDFEKVNLRIGTIVEVEDFPEARKPAYKMKIDFGNEIGTKNSSAQIVDLYEKKMLINKQVLCVVNFPPKQIGPFLSEVLVTGIADENENVVLVTVDKKVPNGSKLF